MPLKIPHQTVKITIRDSVGENGLHGDGRVEVEMWFEPGLKKRTTNSNAINLGLRLKGIIEKHWQELSLPPETKKPKLERPRIITPPGFDVPLQVLDAPKPEPVDSGFDTPPES